MRRAFALLTAAAAPLLLAGASARNVAELPPPGEALASARAEARAADAELRRLEAAAGKARGNAARLAAERRAAAAAVTRSEAEISLAEARLRLAQQAVERQRRRLAERRAPLAALVAGMVTIGRRPPVLGVADSASLDELVRVRVLLDTALPVIRERSAALAGELERGDRLAEAAAAARDRLRQARAALQDRQRRFAFLEARASQQAAELGAGTVAAGDVLIASAERENLALSQAGRRRAEARLAAALAPLPPAAPRPGTRPPPKPPLAYMLPVNAPVAEGLGSVDQSGIRSRGIVLAAQAGDRVVVPATGRVAFAGPFRRHDGVVIIDHRNGWMTLMTGIRTDRRQGEAVSLGEPLGRALGPVTVELSVDGRPVSAALIAGSSQLLSKKGKSG